MPAALHTQIAFVVCSYFCQSLPYLESTVCGEALPDAGECTVQYSLNFFLHLSFLTENVFFLENYARWMMVITED